MESDRDYKTRTHQERVESSLSDIAKELWRSNSGIPSSSDSWSFWDVIKGHPVIVGFLIFNLILYGWYNLYIQDPFARIIVKIVKTLHLPIDLTMRHVNILFAVIVIGLEILLVVRVFLWLSGGTKKPSFSEAQINEFEKRFMVGDYSAEMRDFFESPKGNETLENWNKKYGRNHKTYLRDFEEDCHTIELAKWEELYKTGCVNSEMRTFFISTDEGKATLEKWKQLYGYNIRLI